MDVKKLKYLWKVIGVFAAFLLQSLVFENLNILSSSPDILLTVIIMISVSLDFTWASAVGAFAGIIMDSMYGSVFGVKTLMYMYLALLVSIAADKKNDNSPLIMGWICFISITVMEITMAIINAIIGSPIKFTYLIADIFVKGIFSAVFAILYTLATECVKKRKQKGKDSAKEETADE